MTKIYIQKFIKVDNVHTVAYREYGNPCGIPVLFLHGGPGGCINYNNLDLIDLSYYRVFTIDQRGCGNSIPRGELSANTLEYLIEDMEKIRQAENIGKCVIFGRSWGVVLGLMYTLKYPENCLYLILRGVFLGRNIDELWTFEGAKVKYPKQWGDFSEGLNVKKPLNVQFYEKIFSEDIQTALLYSARLTRYFKILSSNNPDVPLVSENLDGLLANRIFLHYSVNNYFFDDSYWEEHLNELDDNNIQGVIIHGGQDSDCLVDQAFYLHKKWKNSKLIIEKNAFHCDDQPEIRKHIKVVFNDLSCLLQNKGVVRLKENKC